MAWGWLVDFFLKSDGGRDASHGEGGVAGGAEPAQVEKPYTGALLDHLADLEVERLVFDVADLGHDSEMESLDGMSLGILNWHDV